LWFANEEAGDEGRALAVDKDGVAWQLPRLGLFSYENAIPASNTSDSTVVIGSEDGAATDAAFRAAYGKGNPQPFSLAGIDWTNNGAAQNVEAAAKGVSLNRIEDGAFDPANPNDLYFVTTEGGDKSANPDEPTTPRDGGGLWRLRFTDIERPELGGTLELLLDGSEAPYLSKPDNLTVDAGIVLIQEDPGNNAHIAAVLGR
jgi:hypothetical protein